jgi:hypothetical protein
MDQWLCLRCMLPLTLAQGLALALPSRVDLQSQQRARPILLKGYEV